MASSPPLHHSDAGPAGPARRPDACGGGVLEARPRGHDVFHETLGKILLLGVSAHALERQQGDRWLERRERLARREAGCVLAAL